MKTFLHLLSKGTHTETYRTMFVEKLWTQESWEEKQKEAVGGVIPNRSSL